MCPQRDSDGPELQGREARGDGVPRRRGSSRLYPFAQSTLSPTAIKLLEAGRRVLKRSGFGSLSLETVAREAGGNKALFRYHFGGKAGFLVALVDWVLRDYLADLRRLAEVSNESNGEDKVRTLTHDMPNQLLSHLASYQSFFDLIPNVLDEQQMRPYLAELYREYRRFNVRALASESTGVPDDLVEEIAAMTIALTDGFAIQLLAEPGCIDVDRAYDHWTAFVRGLLEQGSASGETQP